jgi:lysophospholipase L1-like esterase
MNSNSKTGIKKWLTVGVFLALLYCVYSALVIPTPSRRALRIDKIIEAPATVNRFEPELKQGKYLLVVKHILPASGLEVFFNTSHLRPVFRKDKNLVCTYKFLIPAGLVKNGINTIQINLGAPAPKDLDVRLSNYRKKISDEAFLFFSASLDQGAKAKFNIGYLLIVAFIFIALLFWLNARRLAAGGVTVTSLIIILHFLGYRLIISNFIFWFIAALVAAGYYIFKDLWRLRKNTLNIKSRLVNALVLACAALLILTAGEALTRIYARHYHPHDLFILERPDLSFRLRPNAQGILAGRQVEVNSLGLRDIERPLTKPAGVTRAVCLGDSITFGYGVENTQPYPVLLNAILNKDSVAKYEVINCGQVAYNLGQERLFLQRYAIRFSPDIIIVGICLNDIGGAIMLPSGITDKFFSPFYSGEKYRLYRYEDMPFMCKAQIFILRHSYFGQYLFLKFQDLCSRFKWFYTPMSGDYSRDSLNYFAGAWTDNQRRQQEIFEKELLSIDKLAQENRAKLLVVIFPNDVQLKEKNLRFPQKIIGAFCAGNNIPYLDLLPYFARYNSKEIFVDIGHPGSFGHKVAALAIAEALNDLSSK